jgi:hypothetical protein
LYVLSDLFDGLYEQLLELVPLHDAFDLVGLDPAVVPALPFECLPYLVQLGVPLLQRKAQVRDLQGERVQTSDQGCMVILTHDNLVLESVPILKVHRDMRRQMMISLAMIVVP